MNPPSYPLGAATGLVAYLFELSECLWDYSSPRVAYTFPFVRLSLNPPLDVYGLVLCAALRASLAKFCVIEKGSLIFWS